MPSPRANPANSEATLLARTPINLEERRKARSQAQSSTAKAAYTHTPEDLQKEATYALWVRLRNGDRSARDELVVQFGPLVRYVMGKMSLSFPPAMDYDDVIAAGTIGLLHAIDRFDPDQGVRFQTYAIQRIRGAIVDAIRALSPLSRGASQRVHLLERTAEELGQRYGRPPTRAELAAELQIDHRELDQILLEAEHAIVSIDRGRSDDEDDGSYSDTLHDTSQPSADREIELAENAERLARAIEGLSDRERLVLNLYYHEELTLREISRVINVSESRVSQIHTAAMARLRVLLPRHEITLSAA